MDKTLCIDWITMHIQMPCKEYTIPDNVAHKYRIERMKYQTRHFRAVYEIFSVNKFQQKDRRICTLACEPHSEILSMDSGLLKIDNNYLYRSDLLPFIKQLLLDLDLKFRSYSRLDIALDFLTFSRKLTPQKFIANFLSGDYIKKGRTTKYSLSGETTYCVHDGFGVDLNDIKNYKKSLQTINFQTLKFGTPTSDITYYLYNKKQELEQVKMKPYIMDNWRANGWDGKQDVWRLEFSFSSNTDAIIDSNTGESITFKDINAIEKIQDIYAYHFKKYFSFVHRSKTTKRKSNMRAVSLFADMNCSHVKINLSDKKDSSRSHKIFAKMLHQVNHELRGNDFNLAIYGSQYLAKFVSDRGIEEWAKKKLNLMVDDATQNKLYNEKIYKSKFVIEGETLDFVRRVGYAQKFKTGGIVIQNIACQPIQLKPILCR